MEIIIAAIVTGLLGPIIILLTQLFLKKKTENQSRLTNIFEEKEFKKQDSVNKQLLEIKEEFDADRVSILKFHNGAKFIYGKSMHKFSIIYQQVATGISMDLQLMQNIPIEPFLSCFKGTFDRGINIYSNIPKECSLSCGLYACEYHEKTICGFRNLLLGMGVLSCALLPIISLDDQPLGILKISYIKGTKQFSEEEITKLKQQALRLGGYLESVF